MSFFKTIDFLSWTYLVVTRIQLTTNVNKIPKSKAFVVDFSVIMCKLLSLRL